LAKWAKVKGIDLLGTGDFLHPLWQAELKHTLKGCENGIFEYDGVKFLLTNEISCIYSDQGKTRRIHILIFLPSLEAVAKLTQELVKRKINIASDGRPITGFSAQTICEIVFGVEPSAIIIPAHIWTPWFSLFGSMSGYDKFSDCFGEYSDQILAVETGLSSDPQMNWRIADLDQKSIISCSDALSLPNLGREATIFSGEMGYKEILEDLKNQNIVGTIEFFPEEGKYHFSGHRNCGVVYSPKDLKEKGEICPKCGRKLTIGVMERVEELATRTMEDLKLGTEGGKLVSQTFPKRAGFRMLVGLGKIVAEAMHSTPLSQKVKAEYDKLIQSLGSELLILTKTPLEEIKKVAGERVVEGIERVREGKLHIEPGYDGTYGVIKIWNDEQENIKQKEQLNLF
ncbi:endonuclease Q family protein, partial [Patescibacteria group bacterium]|nr:endonuclease Q family protein [Patescibacteria group bacterium]